MGGECPGFPGTIECSLAQPSSEAGADLVARAEQVLVGQVWLHPRGLARVLLELADVGERHAGSAASGPGLEVIVRAKRCSSGLKNEGAAKNELVQYQQSWRAIVHLRM